MSYRFVDSKANQHDINHCCACSGEKKTPDDGQKNCPKYVQFYSQNKFEELVHLVGFIIRTHCFLTAEFSNWCYLMESYDLLFVT